MGLNKTDKRKFEIGDVVDVYHLSNPRRMYKCSAPIRQFAVLDGNTVVWIRGFNGVWNVDQIEHSKDGVWNIREHKDEKKND